MRKHQRPPLYKIWGDTLTYTQLNMMNVLLSALLTICYPILCHRRFLLPKMCPILSPHTHLHRQIFNNKKSINQTGGESLFLLGLVLAAD